MIAGGPDHLGEALFQELEYLPQLLRSFRYISGDDQPVVWMLCQLSDRLSVGLDRSVQVADRIKFRQVTSPSVVPRGFWGGPSECQAATFDPAVLLQSVSPGGSDCPRSGLECSRLVPGAGGGRAASRIDRRLPKAARSAEAAANPRRHDDHPPPAARACSEFHAPEG